MKRLSLYVFLVLMFSLFTSHSFAETKIKYKTYNKLPCKFNGARVTATAQPNSWLPAVTGGPCTTGKGYAGKMGTSIEVKRGTPVFAVMDMELISATERSAEYHCLVENNTHARNIKGAKFKKIVHPDTNEKLKCRYPFDALSLTFRTVNNDMVLYYHLMPQTPLVPGFGKGKCKIRMFYKKFYSNQRLNEIVGPESCGGIKKKFVKKGELIGYVGHATNDHISFNISPNSKGFLKSPESKDHGLVWENYPKNPNAFLLPIMSKKYLKEIGYYN